MTTNTYLAWTVRYRWHSQRKKPKSEQFFLVGRYWFGGTLPPQMEGHVVCAFKTRREAQAAFRNNGSKSEYGRGRVVRVRVTVREV